MTTLSDVLIGVHVASGVVGLLVAGPVVLARKRRGLHTVLGRVYAAATAGLCGSAFGLVALDPAGLWGLGVIGALTAGWAAAGVLIARHRPRLPGGWRVWHLNLMGSSVLSFVTGFTVQRADGHWLAWVLPTVIGSPLIARASRRWAARPRARAGPVPVARG